jgi:AcrR family transcriptional regulator
MAEIEIPANRRSRRTRRALLDATRAILEEGGIGAVTMGGVAERAGVTRGAVYKHFDSVSGLISGLFDHVADAEGLDGSLRAVWGASDSVAALEAWAGHLARYHSRVLAVDQALQQVDGSVKAVAAHRARVARAQLANCRRLATWLAREDRLGDGWDVDSTRDMLYGLTCSEVIARLIRDRRWTVEQLGRHLARLLCAGFVADNS